MRLLLILAAAAAGSPGAEAAGQRPDRFALALGGWDTERKSQVRYSSDLLGEGTLIDLEDDLGLDDSDTVFRLDSYFRLTRRQRLDFTFFDLSRDGSTVLEGDIQFGDEVFTVGTLVDTEFDMVVYRLAYGFSFLRTDRTEIGARVGVYGFEIDGVLDAPELSVREAEDTFAPFPAFGLYGSTAFARKWFIGAHAEYFTIDQSDVEGQLVEALVWVEFRTWGHVGFRFGYNLVDIDVEDKEGDDEGDLEIDGPVVYVTLRF